MMFIGPDGKINIIATVASSTSLTLEDNYTGSTASGQAYKIITTYEGDISQFSARFTALLARFEGNSDVLYTWLTSTAATMTWTKADGTTETVATLSAITATVPVARGGTGATTAAQARANLGLGSIAVLNSPLPKANGGSGTVLGAFGNLEPHAETDMASLLAYLASADQRNNLAGSVSVNNVWKTVLSVRHRAGLTDGTAYGCVLVDEGMTTVGYGNNFALYKQVANTWLAPVYLWHSGNLVKQASTTDATAGAVMINGAWGVGGINRTSSSFDAFVSSPQCGFIGSTGGNTGFPTNDVAWTGYHAAFNVDGSASATTVVLCAPSLAAVRMRVHTRRSSMNNGWLNVLLSNQYTVDSNGFLKSASPILRLANTPEQMLDNWSVGFNIAGCGAVNNEAEGVTAERQDTGVYLVTGSLGLAESGWTIEIPQDVNGNRLCFVETETAENGDITVHVSKRRFDVETGNVVPGELMDIPVGRWIDLRLSMPAAPEPDYSDIDSDGSDSNDSGSSEPGI
ncbi:hypothetical protein BIY26_09570 [Brenneria goodwinii]|uniref:Phage tail protein C-terminal domain-containing protein n=2 Tax=Brenneria goodwinii TaxID=1109412 RepID=A0AAE8JN66_9GAMM|nr:hypothetical protein BIY26_09570 [Brenneria goodwinii]